MAIDTNGAEKQFIRTELLAGLTFSKIALKANYVDKTDRNRVNARKAYDALVRFIPKCLLSAEEAREVESKMAQLKSELQQLGEEV